MGAGLDDDGRKELRLDQYLDWGRRVSRTGLWWDGFMPVPDWLPAVYVLGLPAAVCTDLTQGQDADRMTLPHQQATKLGQSVPVTKGPFTLVREWQSEPPHCGSHAAYRKLSPRAPRAASPTVYRSLATASYHTHLASHTTVPCPAVRKHLRSTVDFKPSLARVPARYQLVSRVPSRAKTPPKWLSKCSTLAIESNRSP